MAVLAVKLVEELTRKDARRLERILKRIEKLAKKIENVELSVEACKSDIKIYLLWVTKWLVKMVLNIKFLYKFGLSVDLI